MVVASEWKTVPDTTAILQRLALLLVLLLAFGASRSFAAGLDSSVAVTDPETLTVLERSGLGIARILGPAIGISRDVDNRGLFSVRALTPVRNAIKEQIEDLPGQSLDPYVSAIGKSKGYDQRFNPKYIDDKGSGIVLTGVINRMDRGYLSHTECGEIRLVYRFHYSVNETPTHRVSSRLPLTLSLVFNALPDAGRSKSARAGPKQPGAACSDIARRWLKAGELDLDAGRLAAWLRSAEGPLSPSVLNASQIMRIELNMQAVRLPASARRDFGGHAEYLLKIFRWDPKGRVFQEARMENQIDRDAVAADRAGFRDWLLSPANIYDLDRGRLVIADKYLAKRAVSVAPGGMGRSANNPAFGLVEDAAIADALHRYVEAGNRLKYVKSVEGFKLRLNEMSCTGCHQTHGIAGFHYTGADPATEPRRNAVLVPGSAHFFADLPRRLSIVQDFAAGKRPDFERGFAARPAPQFEQALIGTDLFNGWGAICYSGTDESFRDWKCGEGLRCAAVHESALHQGFGTCVGRDRIQVGDPAELGRIEMAAYGNDRYCRISPAVSKECAITPGKDKLPLSPATGFGAARQRYDNPEHKTGGFPGGMWRMSNCEDLPGEATCGRLAKNGFNDCIASGKDHKTCTEKFTKPVGLRACDKSHPCREDYICTAGYDDLAGAKPDKGTCIPPYFVFQFRVDGHPKSWVVDPVE